MARYDLLVIGGGPGGYNAAVRAAQLGMSVAVVDEHDPPGGTCLRVGCIPSKALLESSQRYEATKSGLAEHGINVAGVELDLGAMMRRKAEIVAGLGKGVASLLSGNKVELIRGRARLDGPGRVRVQPAGEATAGAGTKAAATAGAAAADPAAAVAGETTIEATHILLATGSRPATLGGVEFAPPYIGSSTEALSYDAVPPRLVVVGAGYIGLEIGSVWRRLGAEVIVLEFLDRILPGMDDDIARTAQRLFAKQGLQFRLGTRVQAARVEGERCVVEVEGGEPIECDRVLIAVGRVPNTAGLGLESAGIALDERGRIPVDDRFATAAPGVYAIGDLIAGPMLAHKAEREGVACVEGLAGRPAHVDYAALPAVCYTEPEIAAVGRTEAQLKADGVAYRKAAFPFRANGRARCLGEVEGSVKLLADASTDRLLGVHIIGPRAGELIAEAAAAMAFGASSEDLTHVIHAHPTLAEALKEAAQKLLE